MATELAQVCEHINDTFVVKCVEQVQPETYLGFEILDLISAIIAVFSVLAAGFAAYAAWKANKLSESGAKANRVHNMQSVRPLLDFEVGSQKLLSEMNDKETYYDALMYLKLSNHGNGPAIISSITLWCVSKAIELHKFDLNSRDEFLNRISEENLLDDLSARITSIISEAVLKAGSEITLMEVLFSSKNKNQEAKVHSAVGSIKVLINYECIYGEKYTLDTLITKN
ncbi:hypothetical protein DN730_08070 [Marinomonas piezotolerans]|uniref:Uncharacterized protein n=1 Tax=Marinomonas piezotolerans TaxID=2213058 RepID=A0A370U986_9GAMM|nr:hypothetical protein [Marinomonas piezotolerans]RDL44350.1 hypothetical protein DN730_08070 [Marinomonas piezotolerans]